MSPWFTDATRAEVMTAASNSERVLITGYGAATPFGLGAAALHEGMMAGESKVETLKEPLDQLRPGYGGVVALTARDIRGLPNSRDMRPGTMTRYTFLSTLALGSAMAHGEVPFDEGASALRRGFYVASYTNSDRFDKYVRFAHHVSGEDEAGEPTILDSEVPTAIRKFSGFEFLKLMNNMPTAHGGIHARCQGPCNTFLGTPSGGVQAIGRAAEVIRDGLADLMYAGGVGASVHPQMMMVRATRGLNSAPDATPAEAGRPFDSAATGIVPGEGGGVLVLERESAAAARGATVYGELAGYGEWFEAPASPRGLAGSTTGTVRAASKALTAAGLTVADIDLVVAHGEGSTDLDGLEARGLADLLGERAADVPVLSLTAHIGATEAAVGPLSAGLALEVMRTGQLPGVINRSTPIAEFAGPTDSASGARSVRVALVSITTREGINAALVIKAVS
jgi:3-oxoacyl-(acyl-carrier-protein) synthase